MTDTSGGKSPRDKGLRVERELVARHRTLNIHAERVPLSGAQHYRGNGADIDIYAFGQDHSPLVAEVKARATGAGFTCIEKWLGKYDLLFLRRDNADPLVVLPWATYQKLLTHHH